MTPEHRRYADQLMKVTDEVLEALDPSTIKGAINWGDLSCRIVERVELFSSSPVTETVWRVVIEEAAPDAYELSAAVFNALAHSGFKDVEVQLEW